MHNVIYENNMDPHIIFGLKKYINIYLKCIFLHDNIIRNITKNLKQYSI